MIKKYLPALFFILGLAALFSATATYSEAQNSKTKKADITNVIPNFRQINHNLYAGGRPKEAGVEQLAQMGIKTIVDLERGIFEEEPQVVKREEETAEKLGIRFQKVPILSFFPPKDERVDKALSLITDPDNQPVFIHCEHGRDRTGIVIAAYRMKFEGWPPQEAYKEMKKYGFRRYLFWGKDYIFQYARRGKTK